MDIVYSQGDDYWLLGAGWRRLRTEMLSTFGARVVCDAVELGEAAFISAVSVQIFELQRQLELRIRTAGAEVAKIQLSLLGDVFELERILSKDFVSIGKSLHEGGENSPERFLLQSLAQYLEESRRRLLPGSPHRRKAWERIKSIAIRCQSERFADRPDVSWLDVLFVSELLDFIDIHYPTDKNLPRTHIGLEAYINEFSAHHINIDDEDVQHLVHEAWCTKSDISHQEALQICLKRLESQSPEEFAAVSVKFGFGEVMYIKAQDYMQSTGISRRAYQRLIEDGLDAVQACIEHRVRWDWQEL